jgi:hypothetical protein
MVIRRGRVLILSCALALLSALAVALPQAEARTFSTSTSFGFFSGTPDAFLGQIGSNNNRCRAGRIVKVFKERGRRDRLIGRDRASSTGLWEIEKNVGRARYYALVPKKRINGGRNVCRRYKSSTLLFG